MIVSFEASVLSGSVNSVLFADGVCIDIGQTIALETAVRIPGKIIFVFFFIIFSYFVYLLFYKLLLVLLQDPKDELYYIFL